MALSDLTILRASLIKILKNDELNNILVEKNFFHERNYFISSDDSIT